MRYSAAVRLWGTLVVLFASVPAAMAITASATMTATPNGSNYDYVISLHNTGFVGAIETFWFAWLPGYDLLTSQPTVTGTPTNWTSFVEAGYYGGYSIDFYDTGTSSAIGSGQSSSEFKFTSPDSPSVLQGLDPVYGYYPETFSYVYQGTAEISVGNTIQNIPITLVPEPAACVLAGNGLGIFLWSARKLRKSR
jgi:hypothetical protein